ncbi:hypothetical protein [Nostoc sp. FACHB-133]|nr:hypothetical protein [Nostoc sp. FACHB-133]
MTNITLDIQGHKNKNSLEVVDAFLVTNSGENIPKEIMTMPNLAFTRN